MLKEIPHTTKRVTCYNFFDLLRFIAAIMIACFLHFHDHFIPTLNIPNPFRPYRLLWMFSTESYIFVELFFIISGILFIHAYYPQIGESAKGIYYSFDKFMLHRAIRIYPVVILTATVMFITEYVLYRTHNPLWRGNVDLVGLMLNYIFGGGTVLQIPKAVNGPAWYIGVLMPCYIIAYILTLFHKKFNVYLLWAIPICLGIVFIYQNSHIPFMTLDFGRGLVAFFEGCIFEFLRLKVQLSPKCKSYLKVVSAFVIIISFAYMYNHDHGYKLIHNLVLYYDFYIFPALIFLLMHCDWLNKICSSKFIKELGNISYGIYLWNFPIYAFVFMCIKISHTPSDWILLHWKLIWVGILAIHILVGILSYHLYEKAVANRLNKYICKF